MVAGPLKLLGEPGQPVFLPHNRPTFMSVGRRQKLAASVAGIVVAAGSGERLGASRPKALIDLDGRPLWRWAVDALLAGGCGRLVVVAPPGSDNAIQLDGVLVVPGGATRQQSVAAGLTALDTDPPSVVLVHDAARALTPSAVVARVVS
ncbi:MAG: 2-C-methyl-D-erythritol 4-phosphate cytidylyltransferase, partial [Propionibacteriaceae bacterium]|nr:2-C-methyl-D-erythritol 4-phosphate cytidylyltransferase [Propionibacteriaceae bacterium]